MKYILATCTLWLFSALPVGAQTFSSGSTGADGALDLAAMACTACAVQLPPNGVLNYTTVNVPAAKTLTFNKNLNNTPVYLLAQGAVTIAGNVSVSGSGGRDGGPGGFAGGPATRYVIRPGFGPGAGPQPDGSAHGKWVGPLTLVPLVGGSGGSSAFQLSSAYDGLGGGGGLLIASSVGVTITGGILANGSDRFCDGCGIGAGSGGAIRVVASTITASGSLSARGGCVSGWSGGICSAFHGVVRLEAPPGSLSFTGTATPVAVLSTINPAIFASAPASLSIVSVGGYSVPGNSGQRYDTADLLLPAQLPDPISVVVAASNIPVGTQVQISFGTSNFGTVAPGILAGTDEASSATVQVSGLDRTQLAYLFVSATVAVPEGAAMLAPSGPDHVAAVRATTVLGAATQYAFLRTDGSSIDLRLLPHVFLKQFQH